MRDIGKQDLIAGFIASPKRRVWTFGLVCALVVLGLFGSISRVPSARSVPIEVLLALLCLLPAFILFIIVELALRQVKESGAAHQDIEVQWHSLVREAPALIAVLSRDGRVVFINRAIPQTEQFLKAEISTLLSFDTGERDKLRAVIARVFDNKESVRYESRITLLNGQEVFFDNCVGPVMKGDKVQAAMFVAVDVSQRKRVEERSQLLSRAMAQSPLSVMITDAEARIEYVNPYFTDVSGYSLEEAKGRTPSFLKSGQTRPEKYIDLWKALKAGKIWRGVFHNRKKNGELFAEFASIAPVLDDYGRLKHFIAVKEDVTARMRVETALKASERKLNDLINAMPHPLYYKDLNGFFQGGNQAFLNFFGLELEQIVGKSYFDAALHEFDEYLFQSDAHILKDNGSSMDEVKVKSADGHERDVVVYKSVLTSVSGEVDGVVGVIVDVTELKRTTKELLRREADLHKAMEDLKQYNLNLEKTHAQLVQSEKLAAIGFLAAGMAHEINNPLAFIHSNLASLDGYVGSLLAVVEAARHMEQARQAGDPTVLEAAALRLRGVCESREMEFVLSDIGTLLRETKEGVERIKFIVQDLRRFSRVDSTQMAPAHVQDILDSIINIAWNELKYKIDLVKCFDDVPQVTCSVQQLGQVFLNILVNAAQAIKDKGTITIATFCRDGQVCVQFKDTGEGIAKENQTRVFDPFFTTKPPGKGTGLGLSVSYEIIKKHGGVIELQSELGQGSVFTVVLPPANNIVK